MKKALLILSVFFVLICTAPTTLAHIQVDYKEEGSCKILPHTYEVNITNTHTSEDIIRIRKPRDISRWISVTDSLMIIKPEETKTTEITIKAPKDVELGEYETEFHVFSANYRNVSKTGKLCFIVLRDYSMVFKEFKMEKSKYGPGDEVSASITVENDGTKDFEDGKFSIEVFKNSEKIGSDLSEFKLETGKSKTVTASIPLEKYQPPGQYKVNYEVEGAGHTIKSDEDSFEVIETADYEIDETSDGRYIIRTKTIHAENRGNVIEKKDIQRTMRFPISLLTTAEEAEVTKEGLSTTYTWPVELEPGESTEMSYEINYWPLYILVVLLALIAFRAYLYLKAPVVKKEVVKSEVSEDKRVLTISLHVKNRLFGKAKNVILEDSVPSVTRVLDEFDTLEPSIERSGDETTLHWKLGDMDSGDDRIIHYKVKVLVESVDELIFPQSKVRGAVGKRTFERSSSKVKLGV